MIKHYNITVKGRVQGVFFRKYTEKKANDLGLKGTVKNLPDGSVYIEAEGPEDTLRELVTWCHTGPPASRVDKVTTAEHPVAGFADFRITR